MISCSMSIVAFTRTPRIFISKRRINQILPCVNLSKLNQSAYLHAVSRVAHKSLLHYKPRGNNYRKIFTNVLRSSSIQDPSATPETSTIGTLTIQQAQELALRLTADERKFLLDALQEFESKIIKDEYEGQLAAHRWRSKFGRPSKVPKLGDVDPTGSFCPVPEDWLKRKYAATVPPPRTSDLFHLSVANSIPFIGFGFLDNFIMIMAGDYIDHMLGAYICISTMAAAALGNTFSDVIGIGSAYYVERFAERIGFQPPKLTPIQLDMPVSRRASNLGRVLGITIGCILGMIPLLFLKEVKPNEANIKK